MAPTLNDSSFVNPFNSSGFKFLSDTTSVTFSLLLSIMTGIRDGMLSSPLTATKWLH
jgi:hypothetical protein